MTVELAPEVPKVFFRGAATVIVTTPLYTVGTNQTARVKSIVITNTAATAATFDLALDGVKVATTAAIAANSIAILDMDQVLGSAKIIAGGASAITVNFHISGTETI